MAVQGRTAFLWGYARRYPLCWLGGFVSLVLTTGAAALVPWQLKRGIELLGRPDRALALRPVAGSIALLAAVEMIFQVASRILVYRAAREIEYEMRNDLFDHLLGLPQSFYDRTPVGEILSRASNDTSDIRLTLGSGFINVLNTTFHLVAALSMMTALSGRLTLVTLPLIPLLAYSFRWLSRRNYDASEQCQEDLAEISTRVAESLTGHATVLAHGLEAHEQARFDRLNQKYLADSLAEAKVRTLTWPLTGLIAGTGVVAVIMYGGRLVVAGELTVGAFVAFHTYLALILWPLIGFGWILNVIQRGLAAIDRLQAVLAVTTDVPDRADAELPPARLSRGIEVRGLTFTYPRRGLRDLLGEPLQGQGPEPDPTPVLRDVSLTIRPGETVALVGRIGSGKSTLVELLARLYPVPDGTISFDGVDVNRLRIRELRLMLGVVPREKYLFSDTLRANLAHGRPDLDQAGMLHYARASQLDKDVQGFPDGYETLLGERGITLSGGQRQRACLARALAREPLVTILDDGFSAVDTHTEEEILAALRARQPKSTTILISHRPSTIREADRIYVLDQGRIVEEGTHDELLRRGGAYADLIRKAAIREELGLGHEEAVLQ